MKKLKKVAIKSDVKNNHWFKLPISKLSLPRITNNITYLLVGIIIGTGGVAFANPGNIVEKSLDAIGIDGPAEKLKEELRVAQEENKNSEDKKDLTVNQNQQTKSSNESTGNSSVNGDKLPGDSTMTPTNEPTGQYTVITPEDLQALKDKGEPYLIAKTDWNVKINSVSPSYCGSQVDPCPQSETVKVNISPYNVKSGELLPMTECNGVVNKPYSFSAATTTRLIDKYNCEISYKPTEPGMYRLQIELYLSKTVYTDTIYWGGWVLGTDSANADGFFVK